MSNSSLAQVTIYSPNHSGRRKEPISRISPHCVVGQVTAESLGNWFARSSTQASSNYGIDKDGRIGLYVDEANRSWCTSSAYNDNRAITIECASDTTEPYRMNEVVFESLIKLCTDICKRNGKNKIIWIPDKNTALAYEPKDNEILITVHRWYAQKSCPGDWLYNRLGELATRVNMELEEEEEVTQEQFNKMMDTWVMEQAKLNTAESWSKEARDWAETNKIILGDELGRKMYKKYITREEMVTLIHRILKKYGVIK